MLKYFKTVAKHNKTSINESCELYQLENAQDSADEGKTENEKNKEKKVIWLYRFYTIKN